MSGDRTPDHARSGLLRDASVSEVSVPNSKDAQGQTGADRSEDALV